MKRGFLRWYLPAIIVIMAIGLLSVVSCSGSQTTQSDFYNAGNADLSVTGAQFDQITLFRFDTSSLGHTLALPSAADIVSNLSSPYAGEVIYFAVAADGSNPVTLIGGTNVTMKTGVQTVLANTTITMYCELDNVTSGSEAVTIY